MKTIKIKEFEVPVDVIAEVADILGASGLKNAITATDEEQSVVFIEVQYDKDDEDERQAVHAIDDVINDYDEEENNDDEDDDDK
jgi:hypothetical protein